MNSGVSTSFANPARCSAAQKEMLVETEAMNERLNTQLSQLKVRPNVRCMTAYARIAWRRHGMVGPLKIH